MNQLHAIQENALQLLRELLAYYNDRDRAAERASKIEAERAAIEREQLSHGHLVLELAKTRTDLGMAAQPVRHALELARVATQVCEASLHVRSDAARRGAEAMHRGAGTEAAKEKLLDIWASGKHRSKDACAAKEHKGLGIGFSTARRALIKAPGSMRRSG